MMMTKEVQKIIDFAKKEAKSKRHEYLTPEHLLLASLKSSGEANEILNHCNADVETLTNMLMNYLEQKLPVLEETTEPVETVGFQKIISHAEHERQISKKDRIDLADLLVSLYEIETSENIYNKLYDKLIEYAKQDSSKTKFLLSEKLAPYCYYQYEPSYEYFERIRNVKFKSNYKLYRRLYEALPKTQENIIQLLRYYLIECCLKSTKYSRNWNTCFEHMRIETTLSNESDEEVSYYINTAKCLKSNVYTYETRELNAYLYEARERAELVKMLQDLGANPLKELEYDRELMPLIFQVLQCYVQRREVYKPERCYTVEHQTGYSDYMGGGVSVPQTVSEEVIFHAYTATEITTENFVDEYTLNLFKSIPLNERKVILEELENSYCPPILDLSEKMRAGKPDHPEWREYNFR